MDIKKVLLSGICKYYRRGMYDKFLWCVIEMLLFKYHEKGMCLVTNVLNRMRILIMEELLFSNKIEEIVEAIRLIESVDKKNMTIEEIMRIVYSFCEVVKNKDRSRTISYFRNWFRHEGECGFEKAFELDENIVCDKINKFKKPGDPKILLELGEMLLLVLETETDSYERARKTMRLYREFGKITEKCGRRYRRAKGIYLFWEIIDTYMKSKGDEVINKWNIIFEFGLSQYFREKMAERDAFGVWMILYCVYVDELKWNGDIRERSELLCDMDEIFNYIKLRESKEVSIDEDFVIKDWHVNRAYDVGRFAIVGAFVKDEKNEVIDSELYNKMKEFYIKKKVEQGNAEKKKNK